MQTCNNRYRTQLDSYTFLEFFTKQVNTSFPWRRLPTQPIHSDCIRCTPRHARWLLNLWKNNIPIGYGIRLDLRVRLTLLRRTVSRKPWAYDDNESHIVYRYLCQHSHFRYLQYFYQNTFINLRNVLLPHGMAFGRTILANSVDFLSLVTLSAHDD